MEVWGREEGLPPGSICSPHGTFLGNKSLGTAATVRKMGRYESENRPQEHSKEPEAGREPVRMAWSSITDMSTPGKSVMRPYVKVAVLLSGAPGAPPNTQASPRLFSLFLSSSGVQESAAQAGLSSQLGFLAP